MAAAIVGAASIVIDIHWKTMLQSDASSGDDSWSIDRWILLIVAAALPVGTMIQFLVPIGPAGLAVTLSDAIVVLVLPVIVFRTAVGWWPPIESLVPRLPLWLLLMTAALILGFLIGYSRIGLQPWAATRVLGWFMLIGHLAVAVWIASDQSARGLALRVFLAVAAITAGFALGETIFKWVLVSQENCGWAKPALGMMLNANAFGFVLLTALALAAGELRRSLFGHRGLDDAVVILLVVGIGLTASRSAWVSAAAVVGIAFAFGWPRRVQIGIDTTIGVALVLLLFTVLICGQTSAVSDHAKVVVSALSESRIDGSNAERVYSWARALKLLAGHPIFGAGLGAFLDAELARGSTPLIIHSTPLWLLAEAGLVGAAVYLGFGTVIVAALVSHIRRGPQVIRGDAITALLVVAGFAIMSLAQELLYQRCLWVVLALLIFRPAFGTRQTQTS